MSETEPKILICDCKSIEHQIVIEYDESCNLVFFYVHLNKRSFYLRLKYGLKYIFGYKSRYGHFDEFIFNPDHAKTFIELSELLSNNKSSHE